MWLAQGSPHPPTLPSEAPVLRPYCKIDPSSCSSLEVMQNWQRSEQALGFPLPPPLNRHLQKHRIFGKATKGAPKLLIRDLKQGLPAGVPPGFCCP